MKRHTAVQRSVPSAMASGLALLLSLCVAPAGPVGATGAAVLCTVAYAVSKRRDLSRFWAILPVTLALVWLEVAVTEVAVRLA
ncbi:MAG: hypothetical protein M3Z46_02935 [Actinomycetota bacterium]|nr:hypothetical protein [Actinomycetota bacterium]